MPLAPVLGALALFACGAAAWTLSAKIFRDEDGLHPRVAAAAVLALALETVGFNLLSALGAFTPLGGALWWGAALVVAWRLRDRRDRRVEDRARLAAWLRAQGSTPWEALVRGAALALVAWRVLRGLATPPLAWDALTYHLYRGARAVQRGGDVVERFPDQWGYVEFFPRGGDLPWAWFLLWTRSDALLAPTGAAVLALCAAAAACLARSLGADLRGSGRAALLTAMIPAAVNLSTSGYADVFVLTTSLLAGVFLVRLGARSDPRDAALALVALALGACAKLSGIPGFLVGAALVIARSASPRGELRAKLPTIAVGLCAALLVAAPGYVRTLRATGSLTYPLAATLGGRTLSAGNEELTMLFAGVFHPPRPGEGSLGTVLGALVLPKPGFTHELIDWGPSVVVLLPLAWLGARRAWRRPGLRFGLAAVVAFAALPALGLSSAAFVTLRTVWISVIGRLVLAIPAAVATLASTLRGRVASAVCALAILMELWATLPREEVPPVRDAMAAVGPWALLAAAVAAIAAHLAWRWLRAWPLALGLSLATLLTLPPIERARAAARYEIYRAAAIPEPHGAFELHPLVVDFASAWELWRDLDDGAPHTVAITLGWEGIGHNGFRYPMLGASLQNTLRYVPVTRDGAVIDHRRADDLRARADEGAWLRRITEGGFDRVALLHPFPMERAWILAHPERFTLARRSADGRHELWRVVP